MWLEKGCWWCYSLPSRKILLRQAGTLDRLMRVWMWTHISLSNKIHGNYKELKTTVCVCTGAPQAALMVKNLPANANAGDARDASSIPGSRRYPGERNGNPLQYSCLEKSMDRGVWWVTVHRVAKSWTLLKQLGSQHAWTIRYKNTKQNKNPTATSEEAGAKTRCWEQKQGTAHAPCTHHCQRSRRPPKLLPPTQPLDTQLPSPHISTQLTPLLGMWAR